MGLPDPVDAAGEEDRLGSGAGVLGSLADGVGCWVAGWDGGVVAFVLDSVLSPGLGVTTGLGDWVVPELGPVLGPVLGPAPGPALEPLLGPVLGLAPRLVTGAPARVGPAVPPDGELPRPLDGPVGCPPPGPGSGWPAPPPGAEPIPARPPAACGGRRTMCTDSADRTRNEVMATDTAMTGSVLPAGCTRTMAPACPNAARTRSASRAVASWAAGRRGLMPILPC